MAPSDHPGDQPDDPARSDTDLVAELGARLERRRLDRGQTQSELAEEAGLSLATVKRLERGESVQLSNLVRVLRALGAHTDLAAIAPEPAVRPLDDLAVRPRRQRARRRVSEAPRRPWRWGDEDGSGRSSP